MSGRDGKPHTVRRWQDLIAEIPLMALLVVSSVYPFVAALELELTPWELLAASLVLLIPLSALFFRARTAILTGIVISVLAVVAALLLVLSTNQTVGAMRLEADAFINWASSYLKGFRTDIPVYCKTLGLIFTALITVPTCLNTVRRLDAFTALLPGFSVISALAIIGHNVNMPAVFAYLAAAMLYTAYHRFRRHAGEYPPGQAPSPAVFLVSAMPVALVVMATAILLSSLVKIDPAWMKDTREKLLHKQSPVADVVSKQAGNVNTSELGGVPAQDDTVLMKVVSDSADVYLKAMSKDVYTGHSWERSDVSKRPFYPDEANFTDTQETNTGLIQSLEPNKQTRITIHVEYVNLNSPIVYLPLKTESVVLPDSAQPSLVGSDAVMLGTTATAGFSYVATYLARDEAMLDLLAQSHKGYYSEVGGSSEELFARYVEAIYDACTALPDSLPERVRQLAGKITAGAANDYEKARAIEAYLSANYTYTLTPGVFDKSRDFVDQFLFENQRGYCTYFATAMAVLLRCEGIPARYVEGYVLPPSKTGDAYQVTNRQGHAWAEAYFEGMGWLEFEPTSAYAGGARPTAAIPTAKPSPLPTHSATPQPSAQPVSQGSTDKPAPPPAWLLWSAAAVLAFLVLSTALYVIARERRRSRDRLGPKSMAIELFGQCLQVLAKCGFTPGNGEDLNDFTRRAETGCSMKPRSLSPATEIFQLARFSTHEPNGDQIKRMLATREQLLHACKKKLGPIRYGVLRWLWGKNETPDL